jgi:hypothetical protein
MGSAFTTRRAGKTTRSRYNRPVDERALQALPGGDLVLKGLRDLRAGVESTESLLVQIGATNLRLRGLDLPVSQHIDTPEHRLYARLRQEHGRAAHSRHNALVRRLASFERALRCVPR